MKRPLRKRIWFYKPWPGYLVPKEGFFLEKRWWRLWRIEGDEFNWHTLCLGNPVIGMLIFALKPCPMTGECADFAKKCPEEFSHQWPVDMYGHNTEGICFNKNCYCKEPDYDDIA